MSMVLVVDSNREPLDPCHPARARQMLRKAKAAVLRKYPFTIILKNRVAAESTTHGHRIKLDPGSKTTGIAIVQEGTNQVVWAAELGHRGQQIRDALLARRALRRSRRNRKTRYRKARFENRRRQEGWLPPSLQSRVANILTWVKRTAKFCPIEAISLELVKFDTHLLQNPEVSGVEYQQGTLAGYEVKEYLLEKWGRRCAYCGKTDVQLEIEHIVPRSRGGSDRVSNLTLACHPCNQDKGNMSAAEYGRWKQKDFSHITEQARQPLKDAAAVNAARWALFHCLQDTGLPIETGSGGLTRFNRTRLNLPKAHWTDAACVGNSTAIRLGNIRPLMVKATGHGNRQMAGTDKFGFPIRHRSRQKRHFGFQTGEIVRAVVPSGKKAGTHQGRVLARSSGYFDVQTPAGRVTGISHRHCRPVQRADGYQYA